MNQLKRALITAEFDDADLSQLADMGYLVDHCGWGRTRQALSTADMVALVPPVSLLVVEVEQVSAEVIAAAPLLETIATCRAGPVNVDVAAATRQRAAVLTTPGRNADSVADFAVGVLLALCRNISRAERHLRQDGWMCGSEIPYFHFRGPELQRKTLGLVGFGAIGRALARRVQGFDMRVLVADPYLVAEDVGSLGELLPLHSVLRQADLLSLHAPLTAESFLALARRGYFSGMAVHRVVPNFVVQDGDPTGTGSGGPGWTIRCEVNRLRYEPGMVGMALSGKDTGGSQWFITHSPQPHLNGRYTIFARVVRGQDVVGRIVQGDRVLRVEILR